MRSQVLKFIFSKEYFLLLLPLYFVFHGYAENFPLISIKKSFILILYYTTSFFLLNALFYFFSKNWRKSSFFTFIVMCCFFFFGSFHDLLKKHLVGSLITKYLFIIPSLFILLFLIFFLIKKTKSDFSRVVGYLNSLLILLLLLDIGQLLLSHKLYKTKIVSAAPYTKCDTCNKPDIFFIIADEYVGNKTLKDQFGFDNSHFENELKKRGFHIIRNSVSNYNYTPYSIASILSMNYLTGISNKSNDNKNRNISYKQINKNNLTAFLSSQGYSFVNNSLFDFADQPTTVNNMFFLTKEKLITHQTLLGRINRDIRYNLATRFKVHSEIKRLALSTLKNNKKLLTDTYASAKSKLPAPQFVYTHLMMPHYPYYFDHNGRPFPLDSLEEGNQINKEQYKEYLQYCNKTFLDLLDSILLNRKKPPIIVFMGDHGFRHFTEPVDEIYQFLNLNAVYLPDKNYKEFYDGISAVNQFRVILNTQFNQNFPLLKDSTIILKEY